VAVALQRGSGYVHTQTKEGMDVISSVHVSDPPRRPWENAAWNSQQMLDGEGGRLFKRGSLTSAIGVIGHENSRTA
jgi:Zn-dependent metalloprotease